ncbi:hypothetical protein JCM9533A_39930 [Catenuloplanes niger JCM 9533]
MAAAATRTADPVAGSSARPAQGYGAVPAPDSRSARRVRRFLTQAVAAASAATIAAMIICRSSASGRGRA